MLQLSEDRRISHSMGLCQELIITVRLKRAVEYNDNWAIVEKERDCRVSRLMRALRESERAEGDRALVIDIFRSIEAGTKLSRLK